jgi:hypothetical protein
MSGVLPMVLRLLGVFNAVVKQKIMFHVVMLLMNLWQMMTRKTSQ